MPLSDKDGADLIRRLHRSNRDYISKTFDLKAEEVEFLFEAWKLYCKERPEILQDSVLLATRCFDSFVHGYVASKESTRVGQNRSAV
jgi:hypothetical protein